MAACRYPVGFLSVRNCRGNLDRLGYKYRVVNAGISGDTTEWRTVANRLRTCRETEDRHSGTGRQRWDCKVTSSGTGNETKPRTNDRQVSTSRGHGHPRRNDAAVELRTRLHSRATGKDLSSDLAKQHKTVLMPFFLDGVAGRADLNQEDFIHPTGPGYTIIVQNLSSPYLKPLLQK